MRARRSSSRVILGTAALVLAVSTAGCRRAEARQVQGGDADRGKVAIREYGCGSCHTIPGIIGARGLVGPPLTKWAQRSYIAGNVTNNPEFLIRWLEVPQAIKPRTPMPTLGVTEGDARDIAAYLYTLR